MEKTLLKIQAEKESIKRINLSEKYSLTIVPAIIKECPKLAILDLSHTSITSIPDFVFQMPHLKQLSYIGCTKLESQPTGFGFASGLTSLSIHVQGGQIISPEIFGLPKLKSLTLNGAISEIPKEIEELSTLEILKLLDTEVKTLPKEISQLTKLKSVSFWQALFTSKDEPIELKLDEIFSILSKSQKIRVSSNQIPAQQIDRLKKTLRTTKVIG